MIEATVFVVDDDAGVLDSLRWLIGSAGFAVRTFAGAGKFLEVYDPALLGCLVLDVKMPGMNGLELQEKMRDINPALPIIMITAHGDIPMAIKATKAGAIDFLEKPFRGAELLKRIRAAVEIGRTAHEHATRRAEILALLARLTPRENQVLDGLLAGKSNRVIAADLGIRKKTVETHRAHVMTKMRVRSLVKLTHLAIEAGKDIRAESSPG